MKSKLQKKAGAELRRLRSLLKKAINGKKISSNSKYSYLIGDLSELVEYYQCVSENKIAKAYQLQIYMDTATRDDINFNVFEQVQKFGHKNEKE